MRYATLLLLALQLPSQAHPSQARLPHGRAEKPLYDSTRMDLSNSPGISHKTAMQAARTYGKIGAHQRLNHDDSVFLRKWSPDIIGAADGTEKSGKKAPKK
jgi:hypothetical protein